jgi:hypothetical protein
MESEWYRKVDTVLSATFLKFGEMQHLGLFRVILGYVGYRIELNAPLTRKLNVVVVVSYVIHTDVQQYKTISTSVLVLRTQETTLAKSKSYSKLCYSSAFIFFSSC